MISSGKKQKRTRYTGWSWYKKMFTYIRNKEMQSKQSTIAHSSNEKNWLTLSVSKDVAKTGAGSWPEG